MKIKSIILCLGLFLAGSLSAQIKNNNIVADFLNDAKSINEVNANRPIAAMKRVAELTAASQTSLSKENMAQVLEEAKSYKYLLIITGSHTIVKITDLEDCTQSGSWGTCMPKGEGYISRGGELTYYDDYINNIMGTPGSQSRMAYFFN